MALTPKRKYELSPGDRVLDTKEYVRLSDVVLNKDFTDKHKRFFCGIKRFQKLRREMFEETIAEYQNSNFVSYASFFNSNIPLLKDLGCLKVTDIQGVAEIIEHIRCVESGEGDIRQVGFGFYRAFFVEHFKRLPKDDKPIKVAPPKKQPFVYGYDETLYKKHEIIVDGKKFRCEKTPIVEKFALWCKHKKISQQEGLKNALDLLFEKYPFDYSPPKKPSVFNLIPLDALEELDPTINSVDGTTKIEVEMPTQLYSLLKRILFYFNRSPENADGVKHTVETLIPIALNEFLENRRSWAIKYGNNDLWKQLQAEKKEMEKTIQEYEQPIKSSHNSQMQRYK